MKVNHCDDEIETNSRKDSSFMAIALIAFKLLLKQMSFKLANAFNCHISEYFIFKSCVYFLLHTNEYKCNSLAVRNIIINESRMRRNHIDNFIFF